MSDEDSIEDVGKLDVIRDGIKGLVPIMNVYLKPREYWFDMLHGAHCSKLLAHSRGLLLLMNIH